MERFLLPHRHRAISLASVPPSSPHLLVPATEPSTPPPSNFAHAAVMVAQLDSASQDKIISPHNLYLHSKLVMKRYQLWRLVVNFLYFRKMDLDFLFYMFFLGRYCKLFEENSFRGRTVDFFYMILFGAIVLTGIKTNKMKDLNVDSLYTSHIQVNQGQKQRHLTYLAHRSINRTFWSDINIRQQ